MCDFTRPLLWKQRHSSVLSILIDYVLYLLWTMSLREEKYFVFENFLSLMYMRSQEECIRSLEQEVQIHPQWVLVTKLYSFGRAANNLNHWASSSALKMHFNAAASSSSCRNGSESWGVASLPYCGSVEFSYWVLQNENPHRELWVVSEHLNLQGVKKWDRKDTPGRIPRRPVTC